MLSMGAVGKIHENGEYIIRQGGAGRCMYVVMEGTLDVVAESAEGEVILSTLKPGDTFGEMALFTGQDRSASVRARGRARVLTVDKRAFLKRVHEDPSLVFRILQRMSEHIQDLDGELVRLHNALDDAPRRGSRIAHAPRTLPVGVGLKMVFTVLVRPFRAFDLLRYSDALMLSVILLVIRWWVSPITTVLGMYTHESPMLLPPLFGLSEKTYRFYELLWYGPYGAFIILSIAVVLSLGASRCFGDPTVRFKKVFQIVSLSFFSPWIPTIAGDRILLATVNCRPEFLVPVHLGILAWECVLVAIGFRWVFDLTPNQCVMCALTAASIFLGLGAIFIR